MTDPALADDDLARWGRVASATMHRAMGSIREARRTYGRQEKPGVSLGEVDDITSADLDAQELYVEAFRREFPGLQILAEEEDPRLGPEDDAVPYLTIDPLDGTGAFTLRQNTGVGSMVALVHRGEVLAAYVGDVLTREVIGYAGTGPVRRCLDAEDTEGEVLAPPSAPPAGSGYLSLRLAPDAHSTSAQALIRKHRGIVVYSGGVGVAAMELWRGAVAGLLLPPAMETPWDRAPVVGISNRLGIERWAVAKDGVVPDPSGVDAQLTERTAELLLAPAATPAGSTERSGVPGQPLVPPGLR